MFECDRCLVELTAMTMTQKPWSRVIHDSLMFKGVIHHQDSMQGMKNPGRNYIETFCGAKFVEDSGNRLWRVPDELWEPTENDFLNAQFRGNLIWRLKHANVVECEWEMDR